MLNLKKRNSMRTYFSNHHESWLNYLHENSLRQTLLYIPSNTGGPQKENVIGSSSFRKAREEEIK